MKIKALGMNLWKYSKNDIHIFEITLMRRDRELDIVILNFKLCIWLEEIE